MLSYPFFLVRSTYNKTLPTFPLIFSFHSLGVAQTVERENQRKRRKSRCDRSRYSHDYCQGFHILLYLPTMAMENIFIFEQDHILIVSEHSL
jgi:hypothetical protein